MLDVSLRVSSLLGWGDLPEERRYDSSFLLFLNKHSQDEANLKMNTVTHHGCAGL